MKKMPLGKMMPLRNKNNSYNTISQSDLEGPTRLSNIFKGEVVLKIMFIPLAVFVI